MQPCRLFLKIAHCCTPSVGLKRTVELLESSSKEPVSPRLRIHWMKFQCFREGAKGLKANVKCTKEG